MVFQAIVENAPDGIIMADPRGVIQLWNAGAETIFGYPASEALDQSLDLIIPERQRERHWAGYFAALARGTSKYGRQLLAVPAVRKDGQRISIEFHVVIVKDAAGAVIGIAAIIRDVTERWERERTLRQQLQARSST